MAYIRSYRRQTGSACEGHPDNWRSLLAWHCAAGSYDGGRRTPTAMERRSGRSWRLSPGQGPFGGHGQKIGVRGDVIGGVAVVAMAEIGREQRQHRTRIGALLVPVRQPPDRETVTQVVETHRLAAIEAGEGARRAEGGVQTRLRQSRPTRADEECWDVRHWKGPIPVSCIVAQD